MVGCGHMGQALVAGWLKGGWPNDHIQIIDPSDPARQFANTHQLPYAANLEEIDATRSPDMLLFAIKPQLFAKVAPAYREHIKSDTLVLSIAAGTTTQSIKQWIGEQAIIVRAMPNLPATIGKGATVYYASQPLNDDQQASTETLLKASGNVYSVDDEEAMHLVTALSGSGPGYLFHLAEAFEAAAQELGMNSALAKALTADVMAGTSHMLSQSEKPATQLREEVTSPGGTTEAGLSALMESHTLKRLIHETLKRASDRSKTLANS